MNISGNVQLALLDPLFNICQEKGPLDSDFDTLDVAQMYDVANAFSELLRPEEHASFMCFAVQVAQ